MSNKKAKISLLGLVTMVCVMVAGGGYGIEDLIGTAGPGVALLILLLIPFVWSLPFGMAAAELSSAYPENGGMYIWAKNVLGEKAGFVSGWCYGIAGFVEPATFATLTANYAKGFFPFELSSFQYWMLCTALIVLFAVVNVLGLELVGKLSIVISLLCLIPFIALIVMSLTDIQYSPVTPFINEQVTTFEAVGQGVLIAIWFNTGYEAVSAMTGEIDGGERKLPKAIMLSVPIISILYILYLFPALMNVGNWQDWSSEGPLSFVELGGIVGGEILSWAFVIAGTLCSAIILCEYMAACPRVLSSMAERGQFFKVFAIKHKKYGTPHVSIIISSLIGILLCSSSSFIELVGLAAVLYSVPIILMFIAVIKLRITKPDLQLPYKAPLKNKTFIAYIMLPTILYAISVFADAWQIGILIGLSSIPAYYFFKRINKDKEDKI